jgi:hypothetical protein
VIAQFPVIANLRVLACLEGVACHEGPAMRGRGEGLRVNEGVHAEKVLGLNDAPLHDIERTLIDRDFVGEAKTGELDLRERS